MRHFYQKLRETYQGEEINATATYENGSWTYETENVPAPVFDVTLTSRQAVVFGNGLSRAQFKYTQNIFNQSKLLTYGCNAFYRDHTPDFLICNSNVIAQELINSGYPDSKIVYTNSDQIFNHPGKFYLIPQDPQWNAGAMAAYMAAFDGHRKVFLLGFDGQDTHAYNNNCYADTNGYSPVHNPPSSDAYDGAALKLLMQTYPLVEFVHVNETGKGNIPVAWKDCDNFSRISFHQLVLECDL
jgi:hypothetical protein